MEMRMLTKNDGVHANLCKQLNFVRYFGILLVYLDYSRIEVATDARHRHMKLWLSTANVS